MLNSSHCKRCQRRLTRRRRGREEVGGAVLKKILLGVTGTLIVALLVASGFIGRMVFERLNPDARAGAANAAQIDGEFSVLGEIAKVLGEDFVEADHAKAEALRDGAIAGIFETLNDPHSTYMTPNEYALQKNDFEGAFEGIGATVAKQDDWLIIVQPLPNTPAEKAGLQPGDVILSVDGQSAKGWTVEQGVLRIRGLAGSSVVLAIRHKDGKEQTVTIQRASIKQSSVSTTPPGGSLMDASGATVTDLAYIHIRSFTRSTPDEVKTAIEAANKSGAKGIILDVRSNPGGLLTETIQIADMLLDKGEIVTQVDRAGSQTASATPGTITSLPIVVLQDQFSASGSELLAAALKDNGRAKIIGTRSFGKGTVNHLRELSNGGAVYVSIARWLTPARQQIEAQGVTPDILVNPTQEDIQARRDIWVHRAIETLRAGR